MYVTTEHVKAGKFDTIGVPVKMSETPGSVRRAAPALGQHTAEVLASPPKARGKMLSRRLVGMAQVAEEALLRWDASWPMWHLWRAIRISQAHMLGRELDLRCSDFGTD